MIYTFATHIYYLFGKYVVVVENRLSDLLVALVVIAGILALYVSYTQASLGVAARWLIAIAALVIAGMLIRKLKSLEGGFGMYLLGSKRGIKTIDRVSKSHKTFWNSMAMWGVVVGFGLLSYPLLKGRIDKRLYAFGMLSLFIMMFFVVPYTGEALQFVNLPFIQTAISSASAAHASAGFNFVGYAIDAVSVVAGFSGFVFVSILYNAFNIIVGIVSFIASGAANSGSLTSQIPGVAPIIPGIDLPLAAGIISLAILLIIHEVSHGVLARAFGIKLKKVGLVMLGLIPFGAFVEPDEKAVNRLDGIKQTKIVSAGISMNLIAMLVFFVPVMLMSAFVVPGLYSHAVEITHVMPGYPANGILTPGMIVQRWNGYNITGLGSFVAAAANDTPGKIISVVTNAGSYDIKAAASPANSSVGIVGIEVGNPLSAAPSARFLFFLYSLFSISFLLNFLVGVINLLPIPGFDGWRIYKVNIKSGVFINALVAIIVIGLLVNVLPWFYI